MQTNEIIRSPVRPYERMNFMPFLFGRFFLYGENTAFRFARFFSSDYEGQCWKFFKLSNNTGYMVPDIENQKIRLALNPDFPRPHEEMSLDAFGLVITIYTLSAMFKTFTVGNDDADLIVRHIECLMEYVNQHPECSKISRIVK